MSHTGSSSASTALSGGTPTLSPNTATACFVTSEALTALVSTGGGGSGSVGTATAGRESTGLGTGAGARPGEAAREHAPSASSSAVWAAIRVTFNLDSFSL